MLSQNEAVAGVGHAQAIQRQRGKQQMPSIIGEGIEIVGDMIAETEIQVDGTVRGNLKASHVMIGRTGMVDGSISADAVTIDGSISGDIVAKDAALEANARINGGITVSGNMSIAAGARFDGNVTMKPTGTVDGRDAIDKPGAAKSKGNSQRGSNKDGTGRPTA